MVTLVPFWQWAIGSLSLLIWRVCKTNRWAERYWRKVIMREKEGFMPHSDKLLTPALSTSNQSTPLCSKSVFQGDISRQLSQRDNYSSRIRDMMNIRKTEGWLRRKILKDSQIPSRGKWGRSCHLCCFENLLGFQFNVSFLFFWPNQWLRGKDTSMSFKKGGNAKSFQLPFN